MCGNASAPQSRKEAACRCPFKAVPLSQSLSAIFFFILGVFRSDRHRATWPGSREQTRGAPLKNGRAGAEMVPECARLSAAQWTTSSCSCPRGLAPVSVRKTQIRAAKQRACRRERQKTCTSVTFDFRLTFRDTLGTFLDRYSARTLQPLSASQPCSGCSDNAEKYQDVGC